MDEEAVRRAERLEAEIRRLTARLDRLKSAFSYRLVTPVRLVERRLGRLRRSVATPAAAPDPDDRSYGAWVARYDTIDAADIALAQQDIARFAVRPTLSIALVPGAGPQSLLDQVHRDFEVLAASASRVPRAMRLALWRRGIPLRRVRTARGASEAEIANAMLSQARGDYFLALGPGDRLAPLATYHLARAASVAGLEPALVYGDEDEIGPAGERARPFFKPDWDPELLLAFDYPGPGAALRIDRLRTVGGFDRAAGPAWRWDAALKLDEDARKAGARAAPVHVPFVLLHRGAAASASAGREVVAAALRRRGEPAAVEPTAGGRLAVRRALPTPPPHVSIIVATRDRVDLLRRCVAGVLNGTDYPSLDLTIVDNGSVEPGTAAYLESLRPDGRVTVVRDDRAFNFAALHNRVVGRLTGEIVVLLNNDVEVIGPDWLERLVAQAVRPEVGAVGAKLYYPDETVQHAGMVLGVAGAARHVLVGRRRGDPGPHGLLEVARTLQAVTGACLALRRSLYEAVGGMNEALAVDYNDVDLCLRLRQHGYAVIWEPKAELYHREGATRGRDHHLGAGPAAEHAHRRRFAAETALFTRLWPDALRRDPAYNPNLSTRSLDGGIGFPPRVRRPWFDPPPAPSAGPAPSTSGVALVGHLNAETGLGQAARNCARALAAVGCPVSRHAIEMPQIFEENVPFAAAAERSSPHPTALYYINANTHMALRDGLPLEPKEGRRRIGFWHWELPVFPAVWAPAFDLVDEIWTASRYTAEAIAAATERPVRVIPHPVVAAGHAKEAARARFGLPEDAFVFLSAFDTNSHVARKNPQAVLRAFADAFPGPDGPLLLFKCHGRTGRSAAYEAFAREAAATPRVRLIDRVLTNEEMAMLQASCDAHVSLHRAEGFGLNLAEAMAEGRLAIGTGFSGNLEFMTAANSILIPYRMRAVEPGDYICGQGQWWAEPEHDAAVEALRRAVREPAAAAALARQAASDMAERFSLGAIGRQLLRALDGEVPAVEVRD